MHLPPYYLEVILVSGMACLVTVVMNSRGGLQVLFVSFTKGPGGFPYVLIITTLVPTLIPIDGTTLVDHRVFVLRGDQQVFDGFATLEVSLDATPTTDLFDTFTKILCVGYVLFVFHFLVGSLGIIGAPISHLPGRPVKSSLIDKVGETRFNKVKHRQIKKFQNLVNKKEGNITWSPNSNNNLPQAGNNSNRQAGAPFPPQKAVTTQLDLSLLPRKEKV